MDNKPPTIAIPVPSDKKLVKLSKLIPAPASCCFKLLETIVDITVYVNESTHIQAPAYCSLKVHEKIDAIYYLHKKSIYKTNTIIIVMNHDVVSKRKEAVKKLTERNVTPMFNTYKGPLLSTSIPPM